MKENLILGIETSCDDTSIAILRGNPDDLSAKPVLLAHQSFSQELILQRWGGVVPEIAARNHLASRRKYGNQKKKKTANHKKPVYTLIGCDLPNQQSAALLGRPS